MIFTFVSSVCIVEAPAHSGSSVRAYFIRPMNTERVSVVSDSF